MGRKSILLLIVVAAVAYFYFRTPSADSVVKKMHVDIENMTIEYGGVTYSAEWGGETSHAGDIRYIGRAYDKNAPYITNDAVVTTGEFSDPSIVHITPIRKGSMSWRAQKQPKGTLVVLHFIPASLTVYNDLKQIEEGDTVEFIGREEVNSRIEGSDGSFIGLTHSNHKFLLLDEVYQLETE